MGKEALPPNIMPVGEHIHMGIDGPNGNGMMHEFVDGRWGDFYDFIPESGSNQESSGA
jgi:hypothetical protein